MKPGSLTPKQIATLLDTLTMMENIGEAVRARAIELAHAGTTIPGYEACFSSPRRAWSDDEEANEALTKLGLDKRERYSVELVSPSQAEKKLKLKKLWPKTPRGSAEADFVDPFADLLADKKGTPSIRKTSNES